MLVLIIERTCQSSAVTALIKVLLGNTNLHVIPHKGELVETRRFLMMTNVLK